MLINYIDEIAKLLDLDYGEEFKVKFNDTVLERTFCLREHGVFETNGEGPMNSILGGILAGTCEIIKLQRYLPNLTENEKEYLQAVIRPFKDDVEYISKYRDRSGAHIVIKLYFEQPVIFPCFDEDMKYRGMELEKKYTLEELGLWDTRNQKII